MICTTRRIFYKMLLGIVPSFLRIWFFRSRGDEVMTILRGSSHEVYQGVNSYVILRERTFVILRSVHRCFASGNLRSTAQDVL